MRLMPRVAALTAALTGLSFSIVLLTGLEAAAANVSLPSPAALSAAEPAAVGSRSEAAGTGADTDEGLVPILLGVLREPSSGHAGWDEVTVAFGIRNDGPPSDALEHLGGGSGSLQVAEGTATYDAEINDVAGPALPTGVAICGNVQDDNGQLTIVRPSAVGEIPHTVNPTRLDIPDLVSVDLTVPADPSGCAPTLQPDTPQAPAPVPLTPDSTSATLAVTAIEHFPQVPETGRTRLTAQADNADQFEDLQVTDLTIWLIDQDGVARFASRENSVWDDDNCTLGYQGDLSVPPVGSTDVHACYAYRPDRQPVAAIVESDGAAPTVVLLPAAQ
ncbi:hypothetical protein ACGFZP_39050 [Kitasatospora sp. NPDC048239]|uniref:hypothetical protein n=1 Tax=Kitasatospora sp. NPDC048239 TaxID=3364046 RepID=UPI0037246425